MVPLRALVSEDDNDDDHDEKKKCRCVAQKSQQSLKFLIMIWSWSFKLSVVLCTTNGTKTYFLPLASDWFCLHLLYNNNRQWLTECVLYTRRLKKYIPHRILACLWFLLVFRGNKAVREMRWRPHRQWHWKLVNFDLSFSLIWRKLIEKHLMRPFTNISHFNISHHMQVHFPYTKVAPFS